MDAVKNKRWLAFFRSYIQVTKPGIISGNIITAMGGFLLASKGAFNFSLCLSTLLGLSLIVGSGCVLNNFIDRNTDAKMQRTKTRPTAQKAISPIQALLYALILGSAGAWILVFYVNVLSATLACFGFVIYVLFYSLLKYKTVHATLIGSFAGAIPPMVGYCSVTNQIDTGAWVIFAIVSMWQMPHFFAISIYRMNEYAKANIPVLPLVKGIHITRIQMLLYILLFMACCFSLTLLHYTNAFFFICSAALGLYWLKLCIEGFKCESDPKWARRMFLFSLVVITVLCAAIPFSVV